MALQVVDNHLFVAAWGYGVQVLDISDPVRPRWKGGWNPRRCPVGLHVTGGRAYVANRLAGLNVLDVSNPARPAEVGSVDTPGDATAVCVVGRFGYVADGPAGLRIVDITDPAHPVLLGHCAIPQCATSVQVAGQYAWVTEPNSVQVVDVGDPLAPVPVTARAGFGPYARTQLAGNCAFVATGQRGLLAFDLSTPANPRMLDRLMTETNDLPIIIRSSQNGFAMVGYVGMLTNADFAAYLGKRYSTNLPRNISQFVQNLRDSPFYNEYVRCGSEPRGIGALHVTGTTTALALSWKTFVIMDVSDPAAPKRIGGCDLGVPTRDVRGAGRYAFVMDNGANIHVLDLEDPTRPVVAGRFDSRGYVSAALAVSDAGRVGVTPPAPEFADVPAATNAPVLTDPERLSDGAFAFTLRAQGGASYIVQTSSDFVTWTALSTNTLPASGELRITDPHAAALPNRYYRAVLYPGP